MKNLLVKALRGLLDLVEDNKEVKEVKVSQAQQEVSVTKTETKKSVKEHKTIDSYSGYQLQEFIRTGVEQITAELYVKGYKELPVILEQHDVKVLQTYHLSQLVNLGQYHQEEDNLDQYTREQLTNMIIETNQLQFQQRMIEQGKAQVSAKQIELIKELSAKANIEAVIPTDKFKASEIIEGLKKKLKMSTDNKPSEAQIRVINNLCKKLGKNIAIQEIATDIKSASNLIQNLQDELKAHPELNVVNNASPEQVNYVKRLLNMQKKRWTQKKEEQYSKMTSSEISKAIKELKEECVKQGLIDTKATQGQIDYIISLGKRLNKKYNPIELKALESEQATKVIDNLQREQLYMLYLGNGNQITKKEIADMTIETVRELTKQLQLERKTNYYEKGANDYDGSQKAL